MKRTVTGVIASFPREPSKQRAGAWRIPGLSQLPGRERQCGKNEKDDPMRHVHLLALCTPFAEPLRS
jgi:hypothetical protein